MDSITLTANRDKLRFHADRAERAQMQIEAMEEQAVQAAVGKQRGRMRRSDRSVLPDGYMADALLRDNHQYRSLVAVRNGHQAQVMMYAALIAAGVNRTAYGRHSTDRQHFELKPLETM